MENAANDIVHTGQNPACLPFARVSDVRKMSGNADFDARHLSPAVRHADEHTEGISRMRESCRRKRHSACSPRMPS
jgi:hypothetical protein